MNKVTSGLLLVSALLISACDSSFDPVAAEGSAPSPQAGLRSGEVPGEPSPNPPAPYCAAPPRPYHDWALVVDHRNPGPGEGTVYNGPAPWNTSYKMTLYVDNRVFTRQPGDSYYVQSASSAYAFPGPFDHFVPNFVPLSGNPDFSSLTSTGADGKYTRIKRVCSNGAASYSAVRELTGPDQPSFLKRWHTRQYLPGDF